MVRHYKMVRIPLEVWEDWFKRKMKIEERINLSTHKKHRISLTSVLRFYGKRKAYIFDDEVLNFFKNSKKRKNNSMELL
jgi:hypothetical protein